MSGLETHGTASVAERLRRGEPVDDVDVDALYPAWARRASDLHWTPLDVALRAASLLVSAPGTRVLDVGAGVGKVCLVGALTTTASFFGIEQRETLVTIAKATARRCGAERARYLHGDMSTLDWAEFDAFYLYNPFYEHVAAAAPMIAEPIELAERHYDRYVATTILKLTGLPAGTRVVTYQGFGGPMPVGYRRLVCEPAGSGHLELWEQHAPPRECET